MIFISVISYLHMESFSTLHLNVYLTLSLTPFLSLSVRILNGDSVRMTYRDSIGIPSRDSVQILNRDRIIVYVSVQNSDICKIIKDRSFVLRLLHPPLYLPADLPTSRLISSIHTNVWGDARLPLLTACRHGWSELAAARTCMHTYRRQSVPALIEPERGRNIYVLHFISVIIQIQWDRTICVAAGMVGWFLIEIAYYGAMAYRVALD